MKKQIITALGIFLFGIILVTAQAVLNNRDITLTKTEKLNLESINLGDYSTTDYEMNGNYSRCLNKKVCGDREIKDCYFENVVVEENQTDADYVCGMIIVQDCKNVINTCSGYITEAELDSWEETKMKKIANVTAERKLNDDPEKVSEGVTTIK